MPIVAVKQLAFVWADAGIDAVGNFNHGGLRLAGHRDANGQAAVLVFAGIADEVFQHHRQHVAVGVEGHTIFDVDVESAIGLLVCGELVNQLIGIEGFLFSRQFKAIDFVGVRHVLNQFIHALNGSVHARHPRQCFLICRGLFFQRRQGKSNGAQRIFQLVRQHVDQGLTLRQFFMIGLRFGSLQAELANHLRGGDFALGLLNDDDQENDDARWPTIGAPIRVAVDEIRRGQGHELPKDHQQGTHQHSHVDHIGKNQQYFDALGHARGRGNAIPLDKQIQTGDQQVSGNGPLNFTPLNQHIADHQQKKQTKDEMLVTLGWVVLRQTGPAQQDEHQHPQAEQMVGHVVKKSGGHIGHQ